MFRIQSVGRQVLHAYPRARDVRIASTPVRPSGAVHVPSSRSDVPSLAAVASRASSACT